MSPKRGTDHPYRDARDAIYAVLDAERETMDAIAAVHAHTQTELSRPLHATALDLATRTHAPATAAP